MLVLHSLSPLTDLKQLRVSCLNLEPLALIRCDAVIQQGHEAECDTQS